VRNDHRTLAFLAAEWRDLVIANFEVDPSRLAPLVPAGTELDLLEGRALVSLVGFRFERTRIMGVPIPFHVNFPEVNLRFYVKRQTPEGACRRAVTFIRELVPRRAIALVARWLYDEPYLAVPMRSSAGAHRRETRATLTEAPRTIEYAWRLGGREHAMRAIVAGTPGFPPAGSEAHFTIEHYWGYTARRDGRTQEYEVVHSPWRVWRTVRHDLDIDAGAVYGPAWGDLLDHPPSAVIVAEGSPVMVFPAVRFGV